MEVRSRCIALRSIKFKDKKSIATLFVRELGRVSFVVGDGPSRESRRRRALMQPGSSFDCVIDHRENRSLQTFRDLLPVQPVAGENPYKQQVAVFVADFLYSFLNDAPADALLFDYVERFLRFVLSTRRPLANAPVCFMLGIQRIAGIEPDLSTFTPGCCFDMTNGVFRLMPSPVGLSLDPVETAAIPTLLRMNQRNMHLYRYSHEERARQLDLLLDYFNIHFGRLQGLRSLDILRML